MVLLHRKLNCSKDPEGVQHFPGVPNANFNRNPYNSKKTDKHAAYFSKVVRGLSQ